MSTDNSGNPTPPVEPQKEPQQLSPDNLFADQLASIVTDDGRQKYADAQTALASIPHAQGHIKELTSQVEQLQAELEQRKGAEQLLEAFQQTNTPPNAQPADGLDAAAVNDIVANIITEKEKEAKAQANAQAVQKALRDKFGDVAPNEFEKRANQLGLSVAQLTELSQVNPTVALELFNVDKPVNNPQPNVEGDVNLTGQPAVPEEPDYMGRFRGTTTPLQDKWNKAKEAAASKL